MYRSVAPSISFPESHDTERLCAETDGDENRSRFHYLFSAVFSAGVMIPIGFEFGFKKKLHVVRTRPDDWERTAFDLTGFIAKVNRTKMSHPILNGEFPQTLVTPEGSFPVGIRKTMGDGGSVLLYLINPDAKKRTELPIGKFRDAIPSPLEKLYEITPSRPSGPLNLNENETVPLAPLEIRMFVNYGEPG
jgi:starch synthase (maltosyl-transferring)